MSREHRAGSKKKEEELKAITKARKDESTKEERVLKGTALFVLSSFRVFVMSFWVLTING